MRAAPGGSIVAGVNILNRRPLIAVTLAAVVMAALGGCASTHPSQEKPPAAKGDATVGDMDDHLFYERLERDVGGEKVVLVAVPRTRPEDPPTFYIMENKVWNDLFAVFMQSPERVTDRTANAARAARTVAR